jgi:hypothetical protein
MNCEHSSHPSTSTLEAETPGTDAFLVPAWLRLSARLFATSLDQRLAVGVHPATSPLLVVRSQQIVAAPYRGDLAESWLRLLIEARKPYNPLGIAVPLVSSAVLAAQDQIHSLAEVLVSPLPTVRGVAMAVATLRDGAGPLFNPNCQVNLTHAVEVIIAKLNPISAVSSRDR